jgi:hypothetical protein
MIPKLTKQNALIGTIEWLEAIIQDPTELTRHAAELQRDLAVYKEACNRGRGNFRP